MQEAIEKAESLLEAHAYIKRFQGKAVVVKIGGSIMDEPAALRGLLEDICFMQTVGMKPVLVHGGGKNITEAMKKAGLEAQFVLGRRYTDERTLAIAEHVLVKEINEPMVGVVEELGHRAMSLSSLGSCVVFAKRLFLQDPEKPERKKVDIGYVGEVTWVNAKLINALIHAGERGGGGVIPIISPIARDPVGGGGKLNVNADSVAGHVAAAIGAEKLLLVSDTHGIRTSDDADSFATHLSRERVHELIGSGVIAAGMLPKVEAAMTAIAAGVSKVHIIDGRISHSVMLEIYTDEGIGTEIVA